MTPVVCRAARGLLGWTQDELARRAEVVPGTVRGFELGKSVPRRASLAVIQRTLEHAGVSFVADPDRGRGGVSGRRTGWCRVGWSPRRKCLIKPNTWSEAG